MTIARKIDLVSELEKAKANVSMLESILTIEKQKDKQQLSLSKSQAAVESLSTNIQAVKTELENLTANLTENEEEHRAKAEEWRAKSNQIQRVIFKVDVASNDSSENEEDLEGGAQLAEENAALFRQKLVLRQFFSKIKCKGQEITSLESFLSKKEELQSILENQLKGLTDDSYKGREEYQQKLQADLKLSSIAFSLGSQVECPKHDVLGKEGTIQEQNTKIVEAEAIVKSKDDTTDSQSADIAFFCSVSEPVAPKEDRSVEIHIKEAQAYQRGRSAAFSQLGPLATAGQFIRGRKLEWERDTKDRKLVELEIRLLTMEWLWQMLLFTNPFAQKSAPTRNSTLHSMVLIQTSSGRIGNRGAMKDFYPPSSSYRITYPETDFSKLCDRFMTSINAELTTWTVASLNKYLEDNEKGIQMYKDLKAHHAAGLKMHETYLKNKWVYA